MSDKFIKINLTLQGDLKDFNIFLNEMKNNGYNVLYETDNVTNIHNLNIILPNIPDLERRVYSKYVSNLQDFNMSLIPDKILKTVIYELIEHNFKDDESCCVLCDIEEICGDSGLNRRTDKIVLGNCEGGYWRIKK